MDADQLTHNAATAPNYLKRLPLRLEPIIQSLEGVKARRSTPGWTAFMTYLGWWVADLPAVPGSVYCVVKVPTRSCCAPLVAFGAVLRSAAQPSSALTWLQVQQLSMETAVFLRVADPRGRKRTQRGVVRRSAYDGMVQIDVEDPKHTHWINAEMFAKFEVRLTEHQTAPRSAAATNLLSKILRGFSTEWIHTPATCCTVVTNQARWRQELASIIVAVDRDHLSLSDLLMQTAEDDVPRVAVQARKHAAAAVCDLAILDGQASFVQRDAMKASRTIILLDALEYERQSNEIAAMVASRDQDLSEHVLDTPLFEAAIFARRDS